MVLQRRSRAGTISGIESALGSVVARSLECRLRNVTPLPFRRLDAVVTVAADWRRGSSFVILRPIGKCAESQPRRYVVGEPGEEVAGRIEARSDGVAPIGPVEYGEVLLHDAVALLGSAATSVRR